MLAVCAILDYYVNRYSWHSPEEGEAVVSRRLPESTREDFPALMGRRNDRPPVYLDNACTTLVPRQVIEAVSRYYSEFPACRGGRSRYWFAEEVNNRLEGNPAKGIRGITRYRTGVS